MAVIEGHAEHVMDAVAPDLLPSLPKLRAALDRRRKSQSGLSRLVARLLGLELKMRQYEQGKFFCDAIVRERGPVALHHYGRARDVADARRAPESGRWLAREMPRAARGATALEPRRGGLEDPSPAPVNAVAGAPRDTPNSQTFHRAGCNGRYAMVYKHMFDISR